MVQVSYPGVYIQEVSSGVRTITSVSTSIAAFFGRASKGPINRAVRLLSYADYERAFGRPHPKSDLAKSAEHFFVNGGTDAYVIRLARNASPASLALTNLAGQSVLVATARAEGMWGNAVRLEVDYNTPVPDETFNLRVVQEEGGIAVRSESFIGLAMDPASPRFAPSFVSSSSELVLLSLHPDAAAGGASDVTALANSFPGFSQSRRPLGVVAAARTTLDGLLNPAAGSPRSRFEISVDGSPYVQVDLGPWPTAQINAASMNDIRARIQDRINAALDTVATDANVAVTSSSPAGLGNLLTITSDGGNSSQGSVHIRRATAGDISVPLMLGLDQGGIEPARYSNFRPAPTATLLRIGDPATPGATGNLDALAALQEDGITSITLDAVPIALNAAPFNLQTTGTATNPWRQSAAGYSPESGENDGVREKLRILANAISADPALPYRAELWGYTLAIVATGGTANAQPSAIATAPTVLDLDAVPADSEFIANTRQYLLGTGGASGFSHSGADGSDGIAPDQAAYLGSEAQQTGFHALDSKDLFNLMVLPRDEEVSEATMMSLWGPAATYCKSRRAFLLIDSPPSWTDSRQRPNVVQDTSKINDLRGRLGDGKDHAAVFYPSLQYSDRGVLKTIGTGGALAGLMSRVDASRGVWKAPAGIDAGIRNITGVSVELTDAENGVLNKKGVNCIRVFPNGIVSWGARTLDGDDDFGSEWKYIPIRRLALMIEESLYRGTRWVVFEPNDEPLWAKIRLNVGAFLDSLFRQGAFQGSSPQEAYFVKCDKDTTTQDDRNKGIVNIRVGFAPLKPAEFVVITIQQMAGEL